MTFFRIMCKRALHETRFTTCCSVKPSPLLSLLIINNKTNIFYQKTHFTAINELSSRITFTRLNHIFSVQTNEVFFCEHENLIYNFIILSYICIFHQKILIFAFFVKKSHIKFVIVFLLYVFESIVTNNNDSLFISRICTFCATSPVLSCTRYIWCKSDYPVSGLAVKICERLASAKMNFCG